MPPPILSDEGYIKYSIVWEQTTALPLPLIADLVECRNKLYKLGLIGSYKESGIGFGNVSCRIPPEIGLFAISGTQTGHIIHLTEQHYACANAYDLAKNWLRCSGPLKASSEALTHAALYDLDTQCGAIIHVHHRKWWEELLDKVPTTLPSIPYGTPEMAYEMARLYHTSDMPQQKIVAMAGHEEGILVFDNDVPRALERLFYYWQKRA